MALTGRNMQVRFCLKVVLEPWDYMSLGITTSFFEMLTVLYWTRSKSPSISFGFVWFLQNFSLYLSLYEICTNGNNSWFHYRNMFFSYSTSFAAPLRSQLLTSFQKLSGFQNNLQTKSDLHIFTRQTHFKIYTLPWGTL